MNTDKIEKQIELKASVGRVWRALTDFVEFGAWFRVKLDGPFVAGSTVKGRITHPGYEHVTWAITIERMEPERLLSWRWHPYAIDPKADYSAEEPTLVVFELKPAGAGTELTVVESGFDRVPLARRALAYRMNGDGWTQQMKSIEKHVSAPVQA